MGKHKEKSKKHKKEKHTKHKKRRHNSSSSEDEWVEKKTVQSLSSSDEEKSSTSLRREHSDLKADDIQEIKSNQNQRDDWMSSMPTSFLTSSNIDRRREREETKRRENVSKQYNPRECVRELNPYWKDGGDGLPKFKKPTEDSKMRDYSRSSYNRVPKWKKQKTEDEPLEEKTTLKSSQEKPQWKKEIAVSKLQVQDDSEILSEKELNALAAKLVKAEIMGNTKLVSALKEKLETARKLRENAPKLTEVEDVLLTHTDSKGLSRPVKLQSEYGESSGNHKRKKKVETHKDGERVRYYADDDKYSLKQMFENEKFNTVEDQNAEFIKMSGKIRKNDDLDDIFSDKIRQKESDHKIDARNRDRAITQHQTSARTLDNCNRCIQSDAMLKHLLISMGDTAYLALPPHEPLTDGHCLVVPIRHTTCCTQLDENEWAEILDLRRALTKMFNSRNDDVIFFETAMSLHRQPHMVLECVPLDKEQGDMAPIYFKKAIDESELEWSQNKKLVSLKGRDVRRAVPKGLPYFFVSFGMDEGYAHVIEDEKEFPVNFAQEIIGGMLDLHHSKWRKPKRQSFEEQSKRVLEFSKEWSPFDCTTVNK